jgi:hypothetical protein
MLTTEQIELAADEICDMAAAPQFKRHFLINFSANYVARTKNLKIPAFLSSRTSVVHEKNARKIFEQHDFRTAVRRMLENKPARASFQNIIDFKQFELLDEEEVSRSLTGHKRTEILDAHFATFKAFRDSILISLETVMQMVINDYTPSSIKDVALQKLNESEFHTLSLDIVDNRITVVQREPAVSATILAERKKIAVERAAAALRLCETAQEYADLASVILRYHEAAKKVSKQSGAYTLFIAGAEIEDILRIRMRTSDDKTKRIPFDADLVFAMRSLITAHAGLVALFPELADISKEIERYAELSESIRTANSRTIDPLFGNLLASDELFAPEMEEITRDIARAGSSKALKSEGGHLPIATDGARLVWLRGVLALMGRHAIQNQNFKAIFKAVQSGTLLRTIKNADALAVAIATFLVNSQTLLVRLSDTLKVSFGWVRWLFRFLGVAI